MYADGRWKPLAWAVALYLLAALFSNSALGAQAPVCGGMGIFGGGLLPATARQNLIDTWPGNPVFCQLGTSASDPGTWACSPVPSGFLGPYHWASCDDLNDPNDAPNFFVVGQGICEEGFEPDEETGICTEAPSECINASQDDFFNTITTAVNPGFCEVGDTHSQQDSVCRFSETANQNCDATLTTNATYVALGEFVINETLEFSATPCTTITNPERFEPMDCSPPPPTCPVGTRAVFEGGEWGCVLDDDPQLPEVEDDPPPAPPTSSRESTTTTTTTTTNNPDGSTTTTSTTTTTIGECPPGETCTGGLDYQGPDEVLHDVKDFGETIDWFWDQVKNSPLIKAAEAWADMFFDNETCPTWSDEIPLVDSEFVLDAHCTVVEDFTDEIRAIFLAVWSILALFIILSA